MLKSHLPCERSFVGSNISQWSTNLYSLKMISGLQPYREIREGKVEVPLLQMSVEQWRHLAPRKAGKPHCWMTFGDPKCLRATFQERVAPNWMLWIQKKGPKIKLGSEFQTFFIFNLTWGDDSIWRIFFEWVETTNRFTWRFSAAVLQPGVHGGWWISRVGAPVDSQTMMPGMA